jgi:hypothetical protein
MMVQELAADEALWVEGLLAFLRQTGILAHWQTFSIEAVQRVFLPALAFVLLYGVRVTYHLV